MDMQLGVLPVLKLIFAHPKVTSFDGADTDVAATDAELSFREAHGLGAITASAALVEHKFSIFCFKGIYNLCCFRANGDAFCFFHIEVNIGESIKKPTTTVIVVG